MNTCERCGTALDRLGREDGGWTLHTRERCIASLRAHIAELEAVVEAARALVANVQELGPPEGSAVLIRGQRVNAIRDALAALSAKPSEKGRTT